MSNGWKLWVQTCHAASRLAALRALCLTQQTADVGVVLVSCLPPRPLFLGTTCCPVLLPALLSIHACPPPNAQFIPNKPAPSPGAGWSSGDGRRVPMKGTTGSFTQPNLRQYGPFPDFLKRSCDL